MATFCTIGSVVGMALGFAVPYGQAHAQAANCIVVEIMAEDQEKYRQLSQTRDQETLRQQLPQALDKRGKEKIPKRLAQQGTTDDPGTHPSTRETAFASGQSLANYCDFKVEVE